MPRNELFAKSRILACIVKQVLDGSFVGFSKIVRRDFLGECCKRMIMPTLVGLLTAFM